MVQAPSREGSRGIEESVPRQIGAGVDRLRASLRDEGGTTPTREQVIGMILDSVGEVEDTLSETKSLDQAKR
jgi:hypothetical protein